MATVRSLTPIAPRRRPVYYPESDGKPMAETDIHRQAIVDAIETLQDFFAAEPMVYVSGDLLLYYEEGNPRRSVAPDVFVVRGVPARLRDIYKLWEERVAPQWVLEVTSPSTRREDAHHTRDLYADLGVAEYFLFDPRADYLHPPLQGNVLADGGYDPLLPGPDGGLVSRTLGLVLHLRDGALRFYDPASGRWLPTRAEARRAEAARADSAEEAARAEAARAEAAEATARAQAARADAAEAELARLRALLAERQQDEPRTSE